MTKFLMQVAWKAFWVWMCLLFLSMLYGALKSAQISVPQVAQGLAGAILSAMLFVED